MTQSFAPFRSSFARDIFNQKYRHDGAETWEQLARTLAEDVCGEYLEFGIRREIEEIIAEMKFIPGGRYLYYAGREIKAFNNCFSGDTKVLTDQGMVALRDVENTTQNVLSPVDGVFRPAKIVNHGEQQLQTIVFKALRGHQQHSWTVQATRQHRWLLADGRDTYDLRVGDVVPANSHDAGHDDLGFIHGFVFGDGNSNGQLRLCADKDKAWLSTLSSLGSVTYPPSAKGDPVLYFKQKIAWKKLPDEDTTPAYKASFIRGWLAADGSETSGNKLNSVNRKAIEWFRENAVLAGLTITGQLRSQVRDITLGDKEYLDHEIFIQTYAHGTDFSGYKVVEIIPGEVEEVFCPFEPVYNQIVIDHNIRTYQCYLFRSEEDTREDWAQLSFKAESALTTGGGIGNDYSVYRGKGTPLKRTGGTASGPTSKARMINEIGREVMQGGSRRSAIYASLNADHPDAMEWLYAKDWANMPIPGTSVTYKDVKEKDFNFPAPLDMTNMSLNWNHLNFDPKGKLWFLNALMACKTGEPGFSFNFGKYINETLRNACTEVTSEDDSDVCNIGSINLSRIHSIDELIRVCYLASMFLYCGTLCSDIPFEKVRGVRAKNKRQGLGLMGVHEWLIARGYRYEVTQELHDWLGAYKDQSEAGANWLADRLGQSRPVAYRAIAPTGTIGIMAGTTTGIEPLFAVAYKRRYLKNGTDWHYQYVVDSAADSLIKMYDADPEKIESALDLASDVERRIKFQADVQDYIDMSIASTINLPAWGTPLNNEDTVDDFAATLARYAPRLRGFTAYPDGARGGQPLTAVGYDYARKFEGVEYQEHDSCKGGVCGA